MCRWVFYGQSGTCVYNNRYSVGVADVPAWASVSLAIRLIDRVGFVGRHGMPFSSA